MSEASGWSNPMNLAYVGHGFDGGRLLIFRNVMRGFDFDFSKERPKEIQIHEKIVEK